MLERARSSYLQAPQLMQAVRSAIAHGAESPLRGNPPLSWGPLNLIEVQLDKPPVRWKNLCSGFIAHPCCETNVAANSCQLNRDRSLHNSGPAPRRRGHVP